MSRSMTLVLLAGAASFGVACEKKETGEATKVDAGANSDKYATADSKLTKALQTAASVAAPSENGPPPGGVFSPDAADRRHPRGAPTKVELVASGSEPRISLAPAEPGPNALATSFGLALLEVGLQLGPRAALPTVDLAVLLGPSKGADGGADLLLADVRKAAPAQEQFGQLPPDAERAIGLLGGTQVVLRLTADGREIDAGFRLSKTAPPELERFGELAAQTLVLATVPQPPTPVGVGAQWIAETRMAWSGVDVLAYRAFRLKSIDGNRVTLTIDVKAYATDRDAEIQGVPKGATLQQFDGQAQGEIEVVRGEIMARRLDSEQRLVMAFHVPGGDKAQATPGRPEGDVLTAQLAGQARLARGEDLRPRVRRRGDGHDSREAR